MADTTVYVAAIAASAGILGAAISPVSTAYQNSRQAKRDRQERQDTALREACVNLLRAVGDLRNQVASNHDYHGDEMGDRLAQVRQYWTAASIHAVGIAPLAPHALAEPAAMLVEAGRGIAASAAESTDLKIGMSNQAPDFGELDTCTAAFSKKAVDYARR
jgi:hypothetical protein